MLSSSTLSAASRILILTWNFPQISQIFLPSENHLTLIFFMFLLKDKDTSSRTPLDLLEHGVVLEQSEAFDSTYSSAIYALVLEAIYFL